MQDGNLAVNIAELVELTKQQAAAASEEGLRHEAMLAHLQQLVETLKELKEQQLPAQPVVEVLKEQQLVEVLKELGREGASPKSGGEAAG